MKSVNKLIVTYHSRSVGTLSMTPDNRLCAFQYDREWLANGFSISPLDLPLKPDLFIAKPQPFWGNFGIFEDSLPDGYGRYLLHRLLKKQGVNDSELTPLQRLSIVGTSGMGLFAIYRRHTLAKKNLFRHWIAFSKWHWTYCQRSHMRMKRYFTLIVATQVDAALNVYFTIQKELGW